MSFSRTTLMAAIAAVVALSATFSFADTTFRGIPKADSADLHSESFEALRPYHGNIFHTDVRDDFNNRTGILAGSDIDGTYAAGTRMGFVPPVDTRDANGRSAQGPLSAALQAQQGQWMAGGHGSYEVNNGRVTRTSASEKGVNCLPWRVTPDLGNFYILDASADVADGETVSLGYFGDIAVTGTADGLAGDLGLLVLNMSREGTNINWEVKWEGDIPGSLSGTAGQVALGQDVNLQLGWMDARRVGGPDLFEAWMDDTQLVAGNMGSVPSIGLDGNIDVFGIGFEMSGTSSSIDSFAAAVPEPTSGLMGLMGFIALLGLRPRRRS